MAVAGAIGLASPASLALAQAGPGGTAASRAAAPKPAAAKATNVPGVTVQAPPKTRRIPPEKKAAFDAEAARRQAWKTYRSTTPRPSPASAPPGVSASERAENYPGLHTAPR